MLRSALIKSNVNQIMPSRMLSATIYARKTMVKPATSVNTIGIAKSTVTKPETVTNTIQSAGIASTIGTQGSDPIEATHSNGTLPEISSSSSNIVNQKLLSDHELFPPMDAFNHDPLSNSFIGISSQPFPEHILKALMDSLETKDVEIKPDGLLYLPEIKYRRILNKAFGPGGWALMPRGPHSYEPKSRTLSREYALFCLGRFVSVARGEQEYFEGNISLATAAESVKSNSLMRCCKDLGIASELWDPVFIIDWKKKHAVGAFCTNARTKDKKKLWRRKDREFDYPWKEEAN